MRSLYAYQQGTTLLRPWEFSVQLSQDVTELQYLVIIISQTKNSRLDYFFKLKTEKGIYGLLDTQSDRKWHQLTFTGALPTTAVVVNENFLRGNNGLCV